MVWGITSGFIYEGTIYQYLPALMKQTEDNDTAQRRETLGRKNLIFLVPVVLLAGLCGYRTAGEVDIISMLKLLAGLCVLIAAAMTDLELMRIPNKLVLTLPAARFIFLAAEVLTGADHTVSRLISSAAGAGFCFAALLLISRLSRDGLGMGDVKLMTGLGFLLGFYAALYTLVFSCFVSAAAALVLLAARKKTVKDAIPMGPFLYIGYIAVLLLKVY